MFSPAGDRGDGTAHRLLFSEQSPFFAAEYLASYLVYLLLLARYCETENIVSGVVGACAHGRVLHDIFAKLSDRGLQFSV